MARSVTTAPLTDAATDPEDWILPVGGRVHRTLCAVRERQLVPRPSLLVMNCPQWQSPAHRKESRHPNPCQRSACLPGDGGFALGLTWMAGAICLRQRRRLDGPRPSHSHLCKHSAGLFSGLVPRVVQPSRWRPGKALGDASVLKSCAACLQITFTTSHRRKLRITWASPPASRCAFASARRLAPTTCTVRAVRFQGLLCSGCQHHILPKHRTQHRPPLCVWSLFLERTIYSTIIIATGATL